MISQIFAQDPAYSSLKTVLELFRRRHPALRIFSFGRSGLGRNLYALSIGSCRGASLLVGGMDGQDASSTLLLLRLCEQLLLSLEEDSLLCEIDVRRLLERRGLLLIPCLNPDGISIAAGGSAAALERSPIVENLLEASSQPWQATAWGVQLSRNFDAGWEYSVLQQKQAGITVPACCGFGGFSPFDQPESLALAQLCAAASPCRCYSLASGDSSISYGYGDSCPQASRLIAGVLASSCGFPVVSPSPHQNHATLMAWMIQTLGCPSFHISIHREGGVIPYPRLEEMLLLSLMI